MNTPQRFYRGGERIYAFRGLDLPHDFDGFRPEDWLASTTRLFAEGGDGVSLLSDHLDLPTALAQDPVGWLGEEHLRAHGAEPGILTKLLDAGERLPVHSHPDRRFAAAHLDCDHGKTEAWIVLMAEPGAVVWLGFRDDIPPDALAGLVAAQDERLLAACNRIEVAAGDAILVPAGRPHAIGEGVLVLELQEPTDLSVMLEHRRFGLEEAHAFLGLPRDLALGSVDTRALDQDGLRRLRGRWTNISGVASALPDEAARFFRAQVVSTATGPARLEAGFSVTVVVGGRGTIDTEHGPGPLLIGRGDVLLTPHRAGRVRVEGGVTVIRCMPPVGIA
ncbi:MAG: class I mannose-6-phosphate isomerase [Micrococcales bacterium]|nr:class I mannose-6-phosphate isomerase [Micrococcales bacterium]